MTDANTTTTHLDQILTEGKFSNHDVVEASGGQLSHKNVQKARTGSRPVSDLVARTIKEAVNKLRPLEEPIKVRDLFPGYPRGKAVVPGGESTPEA